MKNILRIVSAISLLALALGTAALAAPPQQGQQQPAKQPPAPATAPATPAQPAAPPVNKEEEDAYVAFINSRRDPLEKQVELGEAFIQKFPESRYRETLYSRLATVYQSQQVYDKMTAAADKALELNPDNVDVLSLMGWMLPRIAKRNELDFEQKLVKAEKNSKHAIELITAMTKPASLSDEEFAKAKNDKLSMAHSGLGMVYYIKSRVTEAVGAYEQATQLSAVPDPSDVYMLGEVYARAKRFADAATTFGKCAEMTWDWQDRCKQSAEQAKKQAAAQAAPPAPAPPKP